MKHTVTEHKLASGAQGLTVHVPASNIFRIIVRFNAGFQFADRDKYEVPHVVEHLMGCGSEGYPKPDEFKIEVERNGAARNAFTSSQKNGYYIECADFERDRILDLFEEYITRPIFPESSFPTEISNVREELIRFTTQHASMCSINVLEL
jgi:predicted Zn-dependent peptidase